MDFSQRTIARWRVPFDNNAGMFAFELMVRDRPYHSEPMEMGLA